MPGGAVLEIFEFQPQLPPDDFEVIAFPLRLEGENGGPARVVASLAP